jgi:hypothetical protein
MLPHLLVFRSQIRFDHGCALPHPAFVTLCRFPNIHASFLTFLLHARQDAHKTPKIKSINPAAPSDALRIQ